MKNNKEQKSLFSCRLHQAEKKSLKDICANEQLSEGRVVGRLITKEHRALVNRRSYVPMIPICPQCESDLINGHCTQCERRGI